MVMMKYIGKMQSWRENYTETSCLCFTVRMGRLFCINPQGFILDLVLLSIFINARVKEECMLTKFAYYMK